MSNEELAVAIQAGDSSLLEQLWKQCYGFIRKQARRWANAFEGRNGVEVDDLTNSGYFALCSACEGFQQGKGSFCSYLLFYLKREFRKTLGIYAMSQKLEPLNSAQYLEAPLACSENGEEVTLLDTLADPRRLELDAEDKVFRAQCAEILHCKVAQLQRNQCVAVEMKYFQNATDQAIADELHCSRSYANTSVKDGLKVLRKQDTDNTLRNLLSDMYYSERNLFLRTGVGFFNRTGSSSPEYEVIRKDEKEREERARQYKRKKNIDYAVNVWGYDRATAEAIFT